MTEGPYVAELRAMARAQKLECICGLPLYHDGEPCRIDGEGPADRPCVPPTATDRDGAQTPRAFSVVARSES